MLETLKGTQDTCTKLRIAIWSERITKLMAALVRRYRPESARVYHACVVLPTNDGQLAGHTGREADHLYG